MTASANTKYIEDYKKPWIRDEPDHFILYVGFNDLNFKLWSDSIVESMVNLPMSLKTKLNDVFFYHTQKGQPLFKRKGSAVNAHLKELRWEKYLPYSVNTKKIKFHHLNKDKRNWIRKDQS